MIARLLRAIRRAWIGYQISSLERQLEEIALALTCVTDKNTRRLIFTSREIARKELAVLRGKFNATLPPGERRTWRTE